MVSETNRNDYATFLARKHLSVPPVGFEVDESAINTKLFNWQRAIVRWACRRGRAALFEDCGLGKTAQQLEWSRLVCDHTGGRVLILTPLAVAAQTKREAAKFGIQADVTIARDQSQVGPQISITNYERLHLFDPTAFAGVVLDESSILKAFMGTTKRKLVDAFAGTPYRLACTATPAPNDRKELGNHSAFLGIMDSDEMLARWFINDSMKSGGYILRPFASRDFWRWIASWAVCIGKPSDIGFQDDGFDLPPLTIHEHVVEPTGRPEGFLFNPGCKVSATNVHREKRFCLADRVAVVADLVNGYNDYWAVWCDTDYEADALRKAIPTAVEVRGSHSPETKEERLTAFSTGDARVIITKSEIAGFGLNWQHCCKTTWFAGYSYERWYQAIRRLWRFGQQRPVECHTVMSADEESIKAAVDAKAKSHHEMQAEMAALMHDGMLEELYDHRSLRAVPAIQPASMPAWLKPRKERKLEPCL